MTNPSLPSPPLPAGEQWASCACPAGRWPRWRRHILLDRDLAPLWHHMENEPLTLLQARALQHEVWKTSREAVRQMHGGLSFESYGHVPHSLRSILRVHTRSMNWVPHRDTPPAQRTVFDAWCQAVRDASLASLDAGLRKALAFHTATSAECA